MQPIITITAFILFISPCYSQQDLAFSKEISYRGDVAYFNGSPFTGILVEEKTNKELGKFRNGLRNGIFRDYYGSAKMKSEGEFIDGAKWGEHTEWFENGNKKSKGSFQRGKPNGKHTEWFINGQDKISYIYDYGIITDGKYITYFENGQKEKEETFSRGRITGKGIYKDGDLYELSTENYSDGRAEGYTKNGVKDGLWVQWYANGEKNKQGNYLDGKENGIWTWWYENGDRKKEVNYDNGTFKSLIYENKVDPALSINANLKQGAYLFRSISGIEADTVYVMVSANFEQAYGDNRYNLLSENIIGALGNRFQPINRNELNIYGKKLLEYSIEFSNPELSTVYDKGETWNNLLSAAVLNAKVDGYRGTASVTMKITKLKSNNVLFNNLIGGQSAIYPNQSDAYSISPKSIRQAVINKSYQAFGIKTQVGQIEEMDRKGNAKSISVMSGDLSKGFKFQIFSEDNLSNVLGAITVEETQRNKSICKIIEGEVIISNFIKSGKKLIAISTYKL